MNPRVMRFAVAAASMATVALELALTRIYSVTMYYHFAFLAISIALLGLATAGTTIYLLPRVFTPARTARLASVFMIGFALSTVWALAAAIGSPIGLADWTSNLGKLAHTYVATAAPLLCSGFAISLAIASAGQEIGRLYMFDLVGAGIGCVVLVFAIGLLGAPGAVLLVGALGAIAAVLFAWADRGWKRWRIAAGIGGVVAIALVVVAAGEDSEARFGIVRNPSKFMGMRAPLFQKWNSFSQISVTSSEDPDYAWIFIDGDAATRIWNGSVIAKDPKVTRKIPGVRVSAIVYKLRSGGPAAIIGPGGGTDVLSALAGGVPRVVGIEINPIIVDDVMKDRFASYSGGLYLDPRVDVVADEGRSYLRRTTERFTSIQATLVDTWAASSSGAFTLSENNIYTVEAFHEFFDALAPGGIVSVTRWYETDRPAEFVRLIAIARRALEERGIAPDHIRDHFLIGSDGTRRATMMVSRDPFSTADAATFAATLAADGRDAGGKGIRSLYLPGVTSNDKLLAQTIETPSLDDFLATLPFDSRPTTDNRPFFFYQQRFGDLGQAFSKNARGQLNNVGIALLVISLGFSLLATLVFVIVPLALFRRGELSEQRGRKLRVIGYFACIGLAFILVEIGFMQQFVLFLGHPVYALAVVLSSLLIASGIGAGLSNRLETRFGPKTRRWTAFALAAVLAIYGLGLSSMFGALIQLALPVRIAIGALLVSVPGLLMGSFVPAGVRVASATGPGLVAWGWGVNGATSVVGSVLAIMLAMNVGFTIALFGGVGVYLLAYLVLPRS